jgi:hypothetical protein
MYTVRQLILESYRMSGIKGVGDTPTSTETSEALGFLNGTLDTFATQPTWAPGIITRSVQTKTDGTVVIAKDLSRVLTRVVASLVPSNLLVTTGDVNKVNIGDELNLLIDNVLHNVTVSAINSVFSFTTDNPNALDGSYTTGTFKYQSEPNKYLIDLVIDPPGHLLAVSDANGASLPSLFAQDFYANTSLVPDGWYYETATDPYHTLYVKSSGQSVKIVLEEPGWRNVTLDTDVSKLPGNMLQIIKWRLAGDLAQVNGFSEMASTCLARYHEANASFRRSRHKSGYASGDMSAPGGNHAGRYNISSDGMS